MFRQHPFEVFPFRPGGIAVELVPRDRAVAERAHVQPQEVLLRGALAVGELVHEEGGTRRVKLDREGVTILPGTTFNVFNF